MAIRLNMKSYGNHDKLSTSDLLGKVPYDQRILYVQPQFCIDNPLHGLYGEMDHQIYGYPYSELTYLLQPSMIRQYQAAGIKVIGYVTCGYEGVGGDDGYGAKWYSLAMLKTLITNMATLDGVDGIFVDECSQSPGANKQSYHQQLLAHIKSYTGPSGNPLIAWGNTGVDSFNGAFYFGAGYDYMQASESWIGQALSTTEKTYGSHISVTGYKRSYTADTAYQLTQNAWNKGLALCYINDREYIDMAPWFERYADKIRGAAPVPPSPPPTPAPVANFASTVSYVVKFTDQSSGNITSWKWDFGDGQISTQQSPTHTYAVSGTYGVKETVTGPGGSSSYVQAVTL